MLTLQDNSFARAVAKLGFIEHIGELATCTNCWSVVRIGVRHSVASEKYAREHAQKCTKRARLKENRTRPNRAEGVR